jgi:hypothetical protein
MQIGRSNGERWSVAHVAGVSLSQPDVALLSPSSRPTVLNSPSLFARSHQEHSVVDVQSAVGKDSTSISAPVGGVNTHSQRSTHNQSLNLLTTRSLSHSDCAIGSSVPLTILIFSHVRILSSSGLSEIFNILESSYSISSVASLVAIRGLSRTVYQLLFTETDGDRLALELHLITLMGSSGSESPT